MNLMEITKGYEPKQNEQTEQMKSLPDTTDKWKQLAKEQAASLELVTEERDELQVRNQKMNEFIQKFQERTHKLKMEKQNLFFENHEMQDEIRKLNDEIHRLTTELSETQKLNRSLQQSKAWDKYSIWILLISVSSIAVTGDVVRKYFPINLILLLGLINIAAMEIKIYCHNKRELY